MPRLAALVFVLFVLLASACSLDPVPLTGKACPCAEGWRCDPVTVTCVPGVLPDGRVLPLDGGVPVDGGPRFDGGRVDGGPTPFDSGPVPFDSGPSPSDSGPPPADSGPPPIDAGPDSGPPPSPTSCTALMSTRSDILFCDGFESSSLAPWTLRPDHGTVTRETSIVHRGLGAMRARLTSMIRGARADAASPAWGPVTSGSLYYRAWYYVPSGFASDNWALLVSSENASPFEGFHIHVHAGDELNVYNAVTGYSGRASVGFPRNRWFCVQMRIDVSGSSGQYRVTLDGTDVIVGTGLDTQPALGYSRIGVGITWSEAAQPLPTVYVDEVAAARNPLPCD